MKTLKKSISMLLIAVLCLSLAPVGAQAARDSGFAVGNTDLNILNGGIMLRAGDSFYFNQQGIFVQQGEKVTALSADDGKNLNLWNGRLYYTVGALVRSMPAAGGSAETIHTAVDPIKQLYVVNGALLYLAEGQVYKCEAGSQVAILQASPKDVQGLIPTEYGNLYLTGELFDYSLRANRTLVQEHVSSCYTDSGYLVIAKDNKNYMAELSALFGSFDPKAPLESFSLHGDAALSELLAPDNENFISEYNDNNELQMDFQQLLADAGLASEVALMAIDPVTGAEVPDTVVIPQVSQGQLNIVKRARQLHEVAWTPLEDRTQWGSRGVFKAETTYTGLPYTQAVNTNGYVGYGVTLEGFAASVLDNTSKFYTSYSQYNKIAPAIGTDCSGFVSYAWGLTTRKTTYSLPQVAEKVGDQSLYSVQVGDCLNDVYSHVVLISQISYDSLGSIVGVEVMEQTPVITRLTRYGQGETRSLASFQSYYLNNGYAIYRNPQRDSVTYTPSTAIPLDGETVTGMKEKAPRTKTTAFVGGKTVELYSETPGAAVYYTLDGSAPSAYSTPYSSPIRITDTTKLRAIAVSQSYAESTVLEYTVKVPPAQTPTAKISSGESSGNLVAPGTKIALSTTANAAIYYTLDGTEPTAASAVYSQPITVNSDITIKAMAQASGYKQSETMTVSFKLGKLFKITASAGNGGSVSPSGASTVLETGSATIKITPAAGFMVADVRVDGVSVGAVESYTFKNLAANHSLEASFKSASVLPFTDVNSSQWFYNAVSFTYAQRLFEGTSDTSFSPDVNMTRGMFVTVLGRYAKVREDLGSPVGIVSGTGVNIRKGPSTDTEVAGFVSNKNTAVKVLGSENGWQKISYGLVEGYIRNDLIKVYNGNYSDLPADRYYTGYAQWACLTGIADGVAAGSFAPETSISREHMCMLLYNYAQAYGKTLAPIKDKTLFTDDAAISAGAKTAVYALAQAGIIEGMGDGSFAPQATATRGQVAQIYMNFYNAVK